MESNSSYNTEIRKDNTKQTTETEVNRLAKYNTLEGLTVNELQYQYNEAEEKFFKSFYYNPAIMTISDLETSRYIDVNKKYEEVFGFKREEVIGKTPLEIGTWKYPQNRPDLIKQLEKVKQGFRVENIDVDSLNCKGETVHTLSSFDSITINKKKYLLGTVLDITKERKLELELKRKQELFNQFFHNSLDIYCVLDYEGFIVEANPAYHNLLGYSENEYLNTPLQVIVYPENKKAFTKALEYLRRTEIPICGIENRVICKDGTCKWFEWMMVPDTDYKRQFIVVVGREISERKEIEAVQKLLVSIIETTHDAVLSLDDNGIILSWNKAAEDIYGYLKEEIIGKSLSILAPSEVVGEYEQAFRKILKGEHVDNMEGIGRKKDGQLILALITFSPIYGEDGKVSKASVIIKDITENKVQENEILKLDRLNIIGELSASIAHEIRNPLTTVKGFLQLYIVKKLSQEDKSNFTLMIDELDRANSIITEFLKIGNNKLGEIEKQNLNEIINKIAPLLMAKALVKNQLIITELNTIPDLFLNAKEIKQLIINLVNNGLEAMSDNGIVTIKTFQEGKNTVLLIKDQGQGIPPNQINRIGESFFTTKKEGTGLGLATCYRVCNHHNAKLSFETGKEGTTFFVVFTNTPGNIRA
ncbi:PAS domain S-box [Desulfosporosinus orientis DSM 765]|uniref:histidine kinase n=1 Tax=Desulfosporosinus orientis (strain ATCC 19365 / DSM 765 / NCIMB 8382 / VKM B-1628 / Singapore I) TaxID=768706 RepID=G7W6Q1_DESOD|nr:PAS domain-containing sensor histidine kinase [Desulfosporosinus orientis]AET69183.1 PAS domain S-box [Desulfosporosinus orientis DSM 765]